jgi:uncharacterized RDD family membrane protein YckC
MGMPPPPPPPGHGSTPPPPPGSGTPPPPPGGIATAGHPPYGYAAPPVGGERAGFGIRLGGYLLDGLLYGLLMAVFMVPGGVSIVAAFGDCVTVDRPDGTTVLECGDDDVDWALFAGGLALIALGFLVVAFIYLRALGRTGQTWGRRIVGIKVIGESTGEPIGFGRALGRQLFAGFISAQILYLGYLWMLWDDKKQTWHDKVVNSIVVKV